MQAADQTYVFILDEYHVKDTTKNRTTLCGIEYMDNYEFTGPEPEDYSCPICKAKVENPQP